MCFQGRMGLPGDTNYMNFETYQRIIDSVSPFTARLYLFWRGEPLLHSELGRMIQYARSKNMYVFISTNAVTLTEEKANELIEAGLDFLLIGFDGATKLSYERMRRGAKFEQVSENIRRFVQLKSKYRSRLPHVCLQFIVSNVNQHELPEFRRLAKQMGVDSYIEKLLDLYVNFDSPKVKQATHQLVADGIWSKYTQEGDSFRVIERIVECDMSKRMVIRADGHLSVCCYDMQERYPIGSVDQANVIELWESDTYTELRAKGQRRELDLCRNCGAGIQR
jgi:radical SAM protein with 4Fe4S-binding SPASM domain